MQFTSVESIVQRLVAGIDEMVALQLSAIIQHPRFKELEALWRGLAYMMEAIPAGHSAKSIEVRILDMSWEELSDDLNLSTRLQSSILYRIICQQELNTLGGHPFGLLLVDHPVSMNINPVSMHDELYTLQLLAELGKEALCPAILSVADDFLGTHDVDIWTDPVRVQRIIDSDDYAGWRRLRSLPVSRFIGLTLPDILLRAPWQKCYRKIVFDEIPVNGMGSDHLWGNSAFAFAGNVIQEFGRIRWFGFLRIPGENGGAVVQPRNNLPSGARFRFTDNLEEFYSEQGFVPLMTCYLDHQLAFFNNRPVYQSPVDENESRITSMLQTTLIGCRFGHYLKVLIREHIGSYRSAEACQRELNDWLQSYTSNVDYADDSVLARYPLKRSRARVFGDEKLGIYQCEVELQPQYQFDVINTSIVLKTSANELASVMGI